MTMNINSDGLYACFESEPKKLISRGQAGFGRQPRAVPTPFNNNPKLDLPAYEKEKVMLAGIQTHKDTIDLPARS